MFIGDWVNLMIKCLRKNMLLWGGSIILTSTGAANTARPRLRVRATPDMNSLIVRRMDDSVVGVVQQ